MDHKVADLGLAEEGRLRIEWAAGQMPVMAALTERFASEQTFKGVKIGACLHVTTETANLVRALRAGGADVAVCASNPLSTQDDVAAALADEGVPTFAVRGEDNDSYYDNIRRVLGRKPDITIDDGCDLVSVMHKEFPAQAETTFAGAEETTTGVIRLRQMAADHALKYAIVAINDTPTKHLFDNRFGTGQSAMDGIIRATNVLIAGRYVVVAGYGDCGRGLASRARGMGAQVIVTEIDPIRAIEAVMEGYAVMPMAEAAKIGDIFCTVTGNKDVLCPEHFKAMKDGAIISNAGHFDVEIDVKWLRKEAAETRRARPNTEEFRFADGKRIFLLAEGRLVNLGAAEGHPAAVMDMSFAGQSLSVAWLAQMMRDGKRPEPQVLDVPADIDREIAGLKLATMGVAVDKLTPEQQAYLASWTEGT